MSRNDAPPAHTKRGGYGRPPQTIDSQRSSKTSFLFYSFGTARAFCFHRVPGRSRLALPHFLDGTPSAAVEARRGRSRLTRPPCQPFGRTVGPDAEQVAFGLFGAWFRVHRNSSIWGFRRLRKSAISGRPRNHVFKTKCSPAVAGVQGGKRVSVGWRGLD